MVPKSASPAYRSTSTFSDIVGESHLQRLPVQRHVTFSRDKVVEDNNAGQNLTGLMLQVAQIVGDPTPWIRAAQMVRNQLNRLATL